MVRNLTSLKWFARSVICNGIILEVTLIFPIPANYSYEQAFPYPLMDVPSGPVKLLQENSQNNVLGYKEIECQESNADGSILRGSDWSQLITKEMKIETASELYLNRVLTEIAARRDVADAALTSLQDAVDLDIASEEERVSWRLWKQYRIDINRLDRQPGYPGTVDWPLIPLPEYGA
jgi:hypothetical protein